MKGYEIKHAHQVVFVELHCISHVLVSLVQGVNQLRLQCICSEASRLVTPRLRVLDHLNSSPAVS